MEGPGAISDKVRESTLALPWNFPASPLCVYVSDSVIAKHQSDSAAVVVGREFAWAPDKGFVAVVLGAGILVAPVSVPSTTKTCFSHVAARTETYESQRSGSIDPLVQQILRPPPLGVVLQP